jgi:hypothetical protein
MRASLFLAICLLATGACGNSSKGPKDAGADTPAVGDGGLDASCFTNPQTHYELINACTTAEKVYKPGHPPLQNTDGTLPPLP